MFCAEGSTQEGVGVWRALGESGAVGIPEEGREAGTRPWRAEFWSSGPEPALLPAGEGSRWGGFAHSPVWKDPSGRVVEGGDDTHASSVGPSSSSASTRASSPGDQCGGAGPSDVAPSWTPGQLATRASGEGFNFPAHLPSIPPPGPRPEGSAGRCVLSSACEVRSLSHGVHVYIFRV